MSVSGGRRISAGLSRTRRSLRERLAAWLGQRGVLPEEFWDDWEAALIQVDLGVETTAEIMAAARAAAGEMDSAEQVREMLAGLVAERLVPGESFSPPVFSPRVVLLVGVNGSGKTTTAAKLARRWSGQGRKVLLAAADTYRAAAIDQIRIWADRVGVELISQEYGADPAAVAFDAYGAASRRGVDLLLVDTAGRLHNREDLMGQVAKMVRVLTKARGDVPPEIYLVLDATVGQNGLVQAEAFAAAVPVSGIVLTKLDGTARGGIVVAVSRRLGLPILYLGVGEGAEDLIEFDGEEFARSLLAWDDGEAGKAG